MKREESKERIEGIGGIDSQDNMILIKVKSVNTTTYRVEKLALAQFE